MARRLADGGRSLGAVAGYAGYQMSANYPLLNKAGDVIWANVGFQTAVNGAFGCASAVASSGNCGSGAASGAISTVGSAYGFMGYVIAGCVSGQIGGGGCKQGAIDTVGKYAVTFAVQYILQSAQSPDMPDAKGVAAAKIDPSFRGVATTPIEFTTAEGAHYVVDVGVDLRVVDALLMDSSTAPKSLNNGVRIDVRVDHSMIDAVASAPDLTDIKINENYIEKHEMAFVRSTMIHEQVHIDMWRTNPGLWTRYPGFAEADAYRWVMSRRVV